MGLFGPPNIEKMKVKRNVKGLIKALGYQKDKLIRQHAAEALGFIGDTHAIEPLIATLKDNDRWVRDEAADALNKLGWHPSRDENGVIYWIARERWMNTWHNCVRMGTIAV